LEIDVATGPGGVGPGGNVPFSAEWLRNQAKLAKKSQTGSADESGSLKESTNLSEAAQRLAITKDEKMLQAMKAELAKLDPESETFMEEATEKLIDSVIDQEYGESFKKKSGYSNLQDKLLGTILSNEATREAVADFFELLLMVEETDGEEDQEFEDEDPEGEEEQDDLYDEDAEEESYEED
jgi:hypothetical protein